ncbi:hypothetical protein H5410_002663 [Solanum commersonii]|uniref:Uncharacterized protein n=1 Tax=Solanum commersonii TaxID=4109 RepID=A0A9J6B2Y6_SOLCO|nr:hypothetical protein H5410_002663 [Solanum commersonii]
MIFLLDNYDLQRKDEPWKIFQRNLVSGLYYPGESYKTRSYYEEILMSTGKWGMSAMKESQISLNNTGMNFTYRDYRQAFDKVLYYNNDKHKHTFLVKVCTKIFAEPIPKWFIKWTKVSLDLNRLYHDHHVCWLERIDQIYFFIEFSIPWIHKWTLEVGFTEENIPCLYRVYYNNFWDKLMKQYPKTKQLIGQELLDSIREKINDYNTIRPTQIIVDNSVQHIARRISLFKKMKKRK